MSDNDKSNITQAATAADPAASASPGVKEVTPAADKAKAKPKAASSAVKTTEGKPKAAETKPQTPPAEKSKYADLVAKYSKLYPGNDTFHVTTDAQVFLSKNLAAAQNHQRSLGEGAVTTIKVK